MACGLPHRALIVGVILAMIGSATVAAEEVTRSASWSTEPALLEQLDAEANEPGFSIRPPRGYQFLEQAGPQGSRAFAWKGEPRPDGTSPYVMVMVAAIPSGEHAPPNDLERALDQFLSGVQRRRTDWSRTASERGQIHGVEFIRASWSGTEPARQLKTHGFSYVTLDGNTVIQVSSQDVEPYAKAALKLAEASALTFKLDDHEPSRSP